MKKLKMKLRIIELRIEVKEQDRELTSLRNEVIGLRKKLKDYQEAVIEVPQFLDEQNLSGTITLKS